MLEKLPQIAEALLKGQVVLLPTDTIYGLSCLMDNQTAIKRVYQIKERDLKKPFIYLVNSWAMAEEYAVIDEVAREQLGEYWPGPNTLLLKSCMVGQTVNNGLETIALRWPKLAWLEELIELVGQPLASTSANLAGQPAVVNYEQACQGWNKIKPDLIIDGGELAGQPSRIIDCTKLPEIKIIR